jgi:glycosyltransferase involved in cell wall biosynthesis
MRILILATDIFTHGGVARYTYTLASCLGGIVDPQNVDVLCFFNWGNAEESPSLFHVYGLVSRRRRATILSRLQFLWKAGAAGIRGYDLVIANHVALAPVAALMKFFFRIPYWVCCYSLEIWWGTSPWRRAGLRNAELILPVSRYTAAAVQQLEGIQPSQVKTIYNAIPNKLTRLLLAQDSPQGFIKELKRSGPLLLSVCSLARGNEYKGVDTVIRALPQILGRHPQARYVVVGEGELQGHLMNLAVELGVSGRVTFLGEIGDEDLAAVYRSCEVFVLASRGQEQGGKLGGEGLGLVYLEAALAGKPVVGSTCGGAPEALVDGKTGILVDATSIDDVARAVLSILNEPGIAAAMGSAGREWVSANFSEKAFSESLMKLLSPFAIDRDASSNYKAGLKATG